MSHPTESPESRPSGSESDAQPSRGQLDASGRFAGRFWWHSAIVTELKRCRDIGQDGYSVAGIAGNLNGFTRSDTERYVRQLIEWGDLEECEPSWNFPDLWVRISHV